MRHISLDDIYLPEEWEDHAQELLNTLRNKTPVERAKLLRKDTNYQLWTLINPILSGISFKKCFYTEASVGDSGEIDHFRPKSSVQKCDLPKGTNHQGYWWLAFLVKNFRLCRSASNKRKVSMKDGNVYGKGTRFPLTNPLNRVFAEGGNLNIEDLLLLDPTNPEDVKLLKFDDTGSPIPKNADQNSDEFKRVAASILIYNLIETKVNDDRGHKCAVAKKLAIRIRDLETKKVKGEDYSKREMIEKKSILHEMVQPYSEFSSAVRCVLLLYRTTPSIRRILGLQN